MVIDVKEFFVVILFLSLIILVITTTVAMIKFIKTLNKVNCIIDNVDTKVNKLNGLFDMIDNTTDVINSFSDRIASSIANGINWLLSRKKKGDNDE